MQSTSRQSRLVYLMRHYLLICPRAVISLKPERKTHAAATAEPDKFTALGTPATQETNTTSRTRPAQETRATTTAENNKLAAFCTSTQGTCAAAAAEANEVTTLWTARAQKTSAAL